ncbi:muscle-specific protein 20-like [Diaphorina citri]|uniref:Muscle-specific protein 20-like n=1 Tax=Diaphorina citri TaxID=121845 RepID=A0A3Q0JFA8_DIACI|nr:muscle-specific protein 20-like [Diaphorina citri]
MSLVLHLAPVQMKCVAGKRDPYEEAEAQQWIEQIIGERFPPGVPYEDVSKLTNQILPKKMYEMKVEVSPKISFLHSQCYKHPEFRGPFLGPKPSEENKRFFTEDQLRAGEGMIGLQAGTNKLASQSGQNFGATRKIILGK